VRPLTIKQRLFVDYYLGISAGNGVDAARRAGYRGSPNVLHVIACDNLRKPTIKAAIADALKKSAMQRDEWLSRLSTLARQEPDRADPVGALQLLGRYYGWLNRHDRRVEKLKVELLRQKLEGGKDQFNLADEVAEAERIALERINERDTEKEK
jgi:hypothetical protein